jgi:16S rRNA (adenine1518-N6/adenine1519-N6)-dimethyltransferase
MKHRARKRFGQNFLTDRGMVQRIVDAIAPDPSDLLLEIGPGQAALSDPLAETGADLHLIEIDRDLAERLRLHFATRPRVQLHVGDALTMDFGALCDGRRFRLVGNLPYNISTPLMFHVLQWSGLIVDMHFMLQREVVARMAAAPGGKAYGKLSIMCQYHCAIAPLFIVPPEAFSPAPRVHSAFVRLTPHEQPPVDIHDMGAFRRLLNQAFSMRRKTLRNGLRGILDEAAIESVGIDPGLRPETLNLAQFAALSNLV